MLFSMRVASVYNYIYDLLDNVQYSPWPDLTAEALQGLPLQSGNSSQYL